MKKKGKYFICPTCNKSFYRDPSHTGKTNYCSRKCGYKKRTGKYLVCPVCNKAFYRKPSDIYGKNIKISYCSHGCQYGHKFIRTLEEATKQYSKSWQKLIYQWYIIDEISIREITRKLGLSNRVIPRALRMLDISRRSVHDRIALQWKNNPRRKKEFGKRVSKLFKGREPWNKGQSKKTNPSTRRQAEWMTGTNNPMYGKKGKANPNYKNGKYTAEKKRFWGTSEYRQWRETVYKRDNYACQKCGDNKGHNLNAHHIKSFVDHPKLRYEMSNGITLCKKCHQITHYSTTGPQLHLQELCKGG